MKAKSILVALVFFVAAGSATATHLLTAQQGYSRKIDVPIQQNNCNSRKECPGGDTPCSIIIDHDGNPGTPNNTVTLFDGVPQGTMLCGQQLYEP